MKISAVINTRNEEANIVRCLRSIIPHVDEIVVVDMESDDETVILTRKYTTNIYKHKNTGYVEPARNFAIEKAKGDWILLIDADEVLPEKLGLKLRKLADSQFSYFRIPRKNLIFGKWVRHSGWWPDYQIRFFKKESVSWSDEIHSIPITNGLGTDLPVVEEEEAFVHYHYQSIEQFLERLNRYTSYEAKQYISDGMQFEWKNVIIKPVNEFLTRFFMWEGYKDGLHGLALSLLQSFSFLIVQLKLWEQQRFTEIDSPNFLDETMNLIKKANSDVTYWYFSTKQKKTEGMTKAVNKIRAKIRV